MDPELRSMIMGFRVTELQALLGFASKTKKGRKNELQARCLDLIINPPTCIAIKIKELHRNVPSSWVVNPFFNANSGFGTPPENGYGAGTSLENVPGCSRSNNVNQNTSYGLMGLKLFPDVDVTLKKLPFYDILSTPIRATRLIKGSRRGEQQLKLSFGVTLSQASEFSNSVAIGLDRGNVVPVQYEITERVILRFCAVEASEEQEDLFPPGLTVKINGNAIKLPRVIHTTGGDPMQPSIPLDIKQYIKCCPHSLNTILVHWMADNDHAKNYALTIQVLKRTTPDELLQRLFSNQIQPVDVTKAKLREMAAGEEDDLCVLTSLQVSVACPLGITRMTYPGRGTACKHLQCFDALAFLRMNEKKPKFRCPVCNMQLKLDDLRIDGYFVDVLQNLSTNAGNDIELRADGSWAPAAAAKVSNQMEGVHSAPERLRQDAACSSDIIFGLDDDDNWMVDPMTGNIMPEPEEMVDSLFLSDENRNFLNLDKSWLQL